jgi:hypothetical protein
MLKPCTHTGCNNPRFSKGLCMAHWKPVYGKHIQKAPMVVNKKKVSQQLANKPISPISKAQAKRLAEYRRLRDQFMRNHPVCQARLDGCSTIASDLHHAAGRCGNNLLDTTTYIALCRNCHSYIEVHPAFAKEHGFSQSRLSK